MTMKETKKVLASIYDTSVDKTKLLPITSESEYHLIEALIEDLLNKSGDEAKEE